MASIHDNLKSFINLKMSRYIFDTLDEGILIVDHDCKVLFYNQTLTKYEGLEPRDVVGKSLFNLFPSLTPEESTCYQVIKTGIPINGRFQRYINYVGRELQTVNTTIPLVENGRIAGALEVSRDMSIIISLTDKIARLQPKSALPVKSSDRSF